MHHEIKLDGLGEQGEAMAGAIGSCVHCGFCLPTCPTYVTMGEEENSPRGRIFLMKEVLEGGLTVEEAIDPIDNCLGCQACVTACPSGVQYGDLITAFRAYAEERRDRAPADRAQRALIDNTLPSPRRFRIAARIGMATGRLARLAPKRLRPMLDLLPRSLPAARPLPELVPAEGPRRARVALLAGCAQQVLDPEIGWATVRVLARNGVETVVPPGQGCCGALAMHAGRARQARRLARRNLDAFPDDVDAVVSNAAGCGSGMREYPLILGGEAEEPRARAFAERVVDVSAFLDDLGLIDPPPPARPLRIAYHDACHLAHAQGVRAAPRRLLAAAGHEVAEPVEWEICCGSAGTYNLEKPATAAELGRRKARNLLATGADLVAAGNIGCLTQIRTHLAAERNAPEVVHTMQVLDRAYADGRRDADALRAPPAGPARTR
jgi:glycolate oxidase iron-sulfur subunit